jgi:hypothetical protein
MSTVAETLKPGKRPQGPTETLKEVEANQWIVVREGKGIVERHPFTSASGAVLQR